MDLDSMRAGFAKNESNAAKPAAIKPAAEADFDLDDMFDELDVPEANPRLPTTF
jgi:hypothetical protein